MDGGPLPSLLQLGIELSRVLSVCLAVSSVKWDGAGTSYEVAIKMDKSPVVEGPKNSQREGGRGAN